MAISTRLSSHVFSSTSNRQLGFSQTPGRCLRLLFKVPSTQGYEFYQLDPSTEVRSQVKYIFFLHRGPLVLQSHLVQRTCSEVEFGWGGTLSSGRQGRCQGSLQLPLLMGHMSLPPTWGDVVPNKSSPQGCADGRGDGRPRTEPQNHGHTTCSCCSSWLSQSPA